LTWYLRTEQDENGQGNSFRISPLFSNQRTHWSRSTWISKIRSRNTVTVKAYHPPSHRHRSRFFHPEWLPRRLHRTSKSQEQSIYMAHPATMLPLAAMRLQWGHLQAYYHHTQAHKNMHLHLECNRVPIPAGSCLHLSGRERIPLNEPSRNHMSPTPMQIVDSQTSHHSHTPSAGHVPGQTTGASYVPSQYSHA
jgi:hypothetical protein